MCKVLSFRITGKKPNSSLGAKALARDTCTESHQLSQPGDMDGARSVRDAIAILQPRDACTAGTESTGAPSPRCNGQQERKSPSVSNMPRKPLRNCCFPSSTAPGRAVGSPCAGEARLERDYCDFCLFLSQLQKAPFIWANFDGRARGISSMNCIWASRPHFSKPRLLASAARWNGYPCVWNFLVDRFSASKQRYLFWPWQVWKALTKQGRPFSW